MAIDIILDGSVGTGGNNFAIDVMKIGSALTDLGPDQGGVNAPPLTISALAQAIKSFQTFQKLPVRDGKIDKNGSTLRRINELLNKLLNGLLPPSPPPSPSPLPSGRPGVLRQITPPDTKNSIELGVWVPVESSLTSDTVFKWMGIAGKGSIYYFELQEDVVPNWFGVLVPSGTTNFNHVHIFFHPTPGQVKTTTGDRFYKDELYKAKTNWSGIFHYLSDIMAAQFCAAATGQVLVMPLLTQGTASTCGIFPQRWEALIGQMLGQIASGNMSPSASPVAISSVVVSSFSAGIAYSAAFRASAKLGTRLRGIIDFDGIFSTERAKSSILPPRAVRMWQTAAPSQSISLLAGQNMFPLPLPRWGILPTPPGGLYPYAGRIKTNIALHGVIPQTMMYTAAKRTGV